MVSSERLLGRWGEVEAAEYLRGKGYLVLGMDYTCRLGEVDIIAARDQYIVFAEVKLRADEAHGMAREFVDRRKQQRIIAAAGAWLREFPQVELQPRFDVIEVYAPEGYRTKNPRIQHLENAFWQKPRF